MDACALFMTTWRFCKATSVFCFTTAKLAPWPDRKASFSRLKLESCVYKEGEELVSQATQWQTASHPRGTDLHMVLSLALIYSQLALLAL